ncbi:MAG: MarR family transcriptional regulator [Candidatus Hydrogenedentes bacterium]|nr:MarR family transcriptional regulator [Candidatus Hydrogenedentota bacterium]
MNPETLQQARNLFDTVRMLKDRLIARVSTASNARNSGSPGIDFTVPQINMLSTIRKRGQVTIKELAELLRVSAPSASSMVDRLVEMGGLSREQNKLDRREVVVRITAEAEEAIEQTERQMFEGIAEILERMGPEDARKWCEVYERIRAILETDPDVQRLFAARKGGAQ